MTPCLDHSAGLGAEILLATMATFWHPVPPSPFTVEPGCDSRGAGSRHSGLALGSWGIQDNDPLVLAPAALCWSRLHPACACSPGVGSLPERCLGRHDKLPHHLRPTRRRRRARGTEAAASPGPRSCGATDRLLWGPLVQPSRDQVHAGHTHGCSHLLCPRTHPYLPLH